MRLSINITSYSWPGGVTGDQLARVVRAADDAGIDTVWVSDHLLQADPNASLDEAMLEAYTTLGFLAAQTRRVRLGTMVSGVTFRAPALLIKAVTTLDVLSGGRAWLGVGAGYQADEARAMGLFLPPTTERFDRLEETLRLAHQMWAGDARPFAGRYLRLEQPISSPPPATRPRPPILIGGMGERRTLPLVARYGNACNLFDVPDGDRTVRHKLSVLQDLCAAAGRTVEPTISTRYAPADSPAALARRRGELADLGIQHLVYITNGPWTVESLERLAA